MTDATMPDVLPTEKLERLVREASKDWYDSSYSGIWKNDGSDDHPAIATFNDIPNPDELHGDELWTTEGGANRMLAVLAPALAAEVLAGRKWETQAREALERIANPDPFESSNVPEVMVSWMRTEALAAMPAERSE